MNFDEFIGQVQSRARLATSDQAIAATRATLQTLSERLAGGTPQKFASELPSEIARFVTETPAEYRSISDPFSVDEFFSRVSMRENAELPDAVHHARCVLDVLQEAISEGGMSKLRAQLPEEYRPLFEAGSEGRMRLRRD